MAGKVDHAAFHKLSYGLYIISSVDATGRKCGCIANTFVQVASDPAMAVLSLNKENATTKAIQDSGCYNVTVLSQDTTMALIGKFGFNSSYDINKFDGVEFEVWDDGAPMVTEDAVAGFAVTVLETSDAETHLVFLGDVEKAEVLGDGKPFTYAYYHEVLKGKTPPKAATYDKEEDGADAGFGAVDAYDPEYSPALAGEAKVGWQCTLCGFIVEGYPDGLPEDFRCPMCGMGREFFERVEF